MSHTGSNHLVTTSSKYGWLTPERLPKVRGILLGLTLFVGLVVWTAFSVGLVPRGAHLADKLQVLGVMTWIYALIQIVDMKIWRSRFAQRRRAASRIPEAVEGWLFGEMFAWFGIVYYVLTDDARWYVAGMLLLVLSFAVFPIRRNR